MTPLLQAHHAMEKMEEFVHKVMNKHIQKHSQAHVCYVILKNGFMYFLHLSEIFTLQSASYLYGCSG